MKAILIVMLTALPIVALAEPAKRAKRDASAPPVRLKGSARSNSCAEFGPGFVRLEGSDTCVKIGGAIGIGGGVSSGGR
jgi:hypothetical protein